MPGLLLLLLTLTRDLLSVSISVEWWLLTSESWGFWEKDQPGETCLGLWTESSYRWSTRLPCVATFRRLQSGGALTLAWTSLWRAVISNGKVSRALGCLCSTGPVCRISDKLKAKGQQRQLLPREGGWRRHRARRRTSPVRRGNARTARRCWRKHRRRARTRGWRGSRRTSQVRVAESEKSRHFTWECMSLKFLRFIPTDFYQAKRRVVWMPRKSGEWCSVEKRQYAKRTSQTGPRSGITRPAQTLAVHPGGTSTTRQYKTLN